MSLDEARVNRPVVAAGRVKPQLTNAADSIPRARSVWTWFWSGLVVACLPMLVIYFARMWRLEQYQYFPFAIGIVAWLVWTRSDRCF
jgi:cobalamin biosynthesis protein CobD/CbiB